MSVARYRDRHSVAGRKSDPGDAVVLANVLRTDMHAHRPLPADSELAQAIAVLARAQQNAVWDRTTAHNKLRSCLREYFPGFLAASANARGGITRPEMACSSSRFLRRSSRTSCDSAVLTPGFVPASTSACRTHLRSVSLLPIPSRRATSRRLRPSSQQS